MTDPSDGRRALLVVDAANVVGSRPDGWWRDRAGAAVRLRDALAAAQLPDEVVLVAEGAARAVPGLAGVEVVAALGSGDDAIVDVVTARADGVRTVVVVTADRELRRRVVELGAEVMGPKALLARLAVEP